jgi:hypothetical protein
LNLSLKKKILFIESGDLGYDWIFILCPLGLITKYGCVASHMAIKCRGFGVLSALGCGDLLYSKVKQVSSVILDCENRRIIL